MTTFIDDPYGRMEAVVRLLGNMYDSAVSKAASGSASGRDVVELAQAYTQAFQAMQMYRLANSVEAMLTSPGIHPDVPEALNRAATALEMLERR